MTFARKNASLSIILLLITFFGFSCGGRRNMGTTPLPPLLPSEPAASSTAPAPVITLSADPATIERGQALTLRWEAQNAGSVRIEPGVGEVQVSGNRQVSPTSSVTYMATAIGPGGKATDTRRITVNAPGLPTETPADSARAATATMEDLFRNNAQEILFDYDKAEIRPDEVSKLESIAAWLKQNPDVRFRIEGHADERGSQEYNLGLGDQRANAVRQFLAAQGVQQARMISVSYGEERPQCSEPAESCYQKNRRASFTFQ